MQCSSAAVVVLCILSFSFLWQLYLSLPRSHSLFSLPTPFRLSVWQTGREAYRTDNISLCVCVRGSMWCWGTLCSLLSESVPSGCLTLKSITHWWGAARFVSLESCICSWSRFFFLLFCNCVFISFRISVFLCLFFFFFLVSSWFPLFPGLSGSRRLSFGFNLKATLLGLMRIDELICLRECSSICSPVSSNTTRFRHTLAPHSRH